MRMIRRRRGIMRGARGRDVDRRDVGKRLRSGMGKWRVRMSRRRRFRWEEDDRRFEEGR